MEGVGVPDGVAAPVPCSARRRKSGGTTVAVMAAFSNASTE